MTKRTHICSLVLPRTIAWLLAAFIMLVAAPVSAAEPSIADLLFQGSDATFHRTGNSTWFWPESLENWPGYREYMLGDEQLRVARAFGSGGRGTIGTVGGWHTDAWGGILANGAPSADSLAAELYRLRRLTDTPIVRVVTCHGNDSALLQETLSRYRALYGERIGLIVSNGAMETEAYVSSVSNRLSVDIMGESAGARYRLPAGRQFSFMSEGPTGGVRVTPISHPEPFFENTTLNGITRTPGSRVLSYRANPVGALNSAEDIALTIKPPAFRPTVRVGGAAGSVGTVGAYANLGLAVAPFAMDMVFQWYEAKQRWEYVEKPLMVAAHHNWQMRHQEFWAEVQRDADREAAKAEQAAAHALLIEHFGFREANPDDPFPDMGSSTQKGEWAARNPGQGWTPIYDGDLIIGVSAR